MKTIRLSLAVLFTIALSLTSCTDTNDGAYVTPISVSEKIHGNWAAISVKQTDEIAKTAGQTPTDLGLSRQFNFTSFNVQFNTDDKNNPTSYAITGNAPALIPASGYWSMPNMFINTDATPNEIYLYVDQAKTQKIAALTLGSVPGLLDVFEFKLTRRTNGVAFVSYTYRLCKVN